MEVVAMCHACSNPIYGLKTIQEGGPAPIAIRTCTCQQLLQGKLYAEAEAIRVETERRRQPA